jgi:anaerobic dimethyl sulfoxide reductase subunit B (iron-sulfur subunit)
MKRKGLLIDYQQCSGCQSCTVACKQEHMYPEGKWGIKVEEKVFWDPGKPDSVRIDYIPFPTEFCDLCAQRTARNEKPACVKHCQSWCMHFGTIEELAALMEDKPRSVLYAR